jgi:hypothetical protein
MIYGICKVMLATFEFNFRLTTPALQKLAESLQTSQFSVSPENTHASVSSSIKE